MTNTNEPTDWFLFEMEVASILNYIERCSGQPYSPDSSSGPESNRWHMALRHGLRSHLHLNVGIPGIDKPDHPIEENDSALFAALIMGTSKIQVVLSGEWEMAVKEGLISRKQMMDHERSLELSMEE